MQVVHTAGVPPSRGKSIFAITNWIQNNSRALRKIVVANRKNTAREPDEILIEDAGGVLGDGLMFSRNISRVLVKPEVNVDTPGALF